MMFSGSWSSEMRMWFSWSYTVFLGICRHRPVHTRWEAAASPRRPAAAQEWEGQPRPAPAQERGFALDRGQWAEDTVDGRIRPRVGRGWPWPLPDSHLQLAPRVGAALVVQTVGPLVLRPGRLALLQGCAPAPAAGLLPLGPGGPGEAGAGPHAGAHCPREGGCRAPGAAADSRGAGGGRERPSVG